jgi:hypothetical protein
MLKNVWMCEKSLNYFAFDTIFAHCEEQRE